MKKWEFEFWTFLVFFEKRLGGKKKDDEKERKEYLER